MPQPVYGDFGTVYTAPIAPVTPIDAGEEQGWFRSVGDAIALQPAWQLIGRSIDALDYQPDPSYDPFRPGELTGYEAYASDFINVRSKGEADAMKRRIDVNKERRRRVDEELGFGGMLTAELFNPINLIPLPGLMGAGLGRGALRGAVSFGALAAGEEALRVAVDPTATTADAEANVFYSSVFGGLLGGALGKVGAKEAVRLGQAYHGDFNAVEQAVLPNAPDAEPIIPGAYGFQARPTDGMATGVGKAGGFEKISNMTLFGRLKNSGIRAVEDLTDALGGTFGVLSERNRHQRATQASAFLAGELWRGQAAEVVQDMQRAYMRYLSDGAGDGFEVMGANVPAMMQRTKEFFGGSGPGGRMTYDEFKGQVFRAHLTDQLDELPDGIREGVKAARRFFEYAGVEGTKTGLIRTADNFKRALANKAERARNIMARFEALSAKTDRTASESLELMELARQQEEALRWFSKRADASLSEDAGLKELLDHFDERAAQAAKTRDDLIAKGEKNLDHAAQVKADIEASIALRQEKDAAVLEYLNKLYETRGLTDAQIAYRDALEARQWNAGEGTPAQQGYKTRMEELLSGADRRAQEASKLIDGFDFSYNPNAPIGATVYHGTRQTPEQLAQFIDEQGNLHLQPSENFGGKQVGVSFGVERNVAADYATRAGPAQAPVEFSAIDERVLKQGGKRLKPAELFDPTAVKPGLMFAGVVDPKGRIWKINFDEGAGDHAGFAGALTEAGAGDQAIEGYVLVRNYDKAFAFDVPAHATEKQRGTLEAIKGLAKRNARDVEIYNMPSSVSSKVSRDVRGAVVFQIETDALPALKKEAMGEVAAATDGDIIVPAGKWKATDAITGEEIKLGERSTNPKDGLSPRQRDYLDALEKQLAGQADKVPVPKNEKNYLPRFWRIDRVLEDEAGDQQLRQILFDWFKSNPLPGARMEDEFINARVDEAIKSIIKEADGQHSIDYETPGAQFLQHRKIDIPNENVLDFIETDIEKVVRTYGEKFGLLNEYARMFGDTDARTAIDDVILQAARELPGDDLAGNMKQLGALRRDIETLRDSVTGAIYSSDPAMMNTRRLAGFARNWATLTSLGRVLFASIPELGRNIMVNGWQRTLGFALEGMATPDAFKGVSNELRFLTGEGIDVLLSSGLQRHVDVGGPMGRSSTRMGKVMEKTQEFTSGPFFLVNGLAMLTDFTKRMNLTFINQFMMEDALKVAGGKGSAKDIERLASYGISIDDAKAIAAMPFERKGRVILPNVSEWADEDLARRYLGAVTGMSKRIVPTASPADLPLLARGFVKGREFPLLTLPFQFMNYGFSAINKVALSALQGRDASPMVGAALLMGLGYWTTKLRASDGEWNHMDAKERITRSVDASGLLGLFSDIPSRVERASMGQLSARGMVGLEPAVWNENDWSQPIGAIGGPAPGKLGALTRAAIDGDMTDKERGDAIRRSLPLNDLIWWRDGLKDLQDTMLEE